jgi:hypothetical protein
LIQEEGDLEYVCEQLNSDDARKEQKELSPKMATSKSGSSKAAYKFANAIYDVEVKSP